MLETCKATDIDELMDTAIPKTLPRLNGLNLGKYTNGMTEAAFLEHFKCAHLQQT
jgi:glycine cleavage system pyridoxal-binding protein P